MPCHPASGPDLGVLNRLQTGLAMNVGLNGLLNANSGATPRPGTTAIPAPRTAART